MRRFTITVSDEDGQVLDAAHRNDKSVLAALANRRAYQAAKAGTNVVPFPGRH